MIDRGALVVAIDADNQYRGVHRAGLDAQAFTGRKGRDLAQRYRDALVAGDGVLEDLDDAVELLTAAEKLGLKNLQVIVFEVPQEPPPAAGRLPLAPTPPDPSLTLLGYDTVEELEPYWSPLADPAFEAARNAHGLLPDRAQADALVGRLNAGDPDEPLTAVRVWALLSA